MSTMTTFTELVEIAHEKNGQMLAIPERPLYKSLLQKKMWSQLQTTFINAEDKVTLVTSPITQVTPFEPEQAHAEHATTTTSTTAAAPSHPAHPSHQTAHKRTRKVTKNPFSSSSATATAPSRRFALRRSVY